MIPEWIKQLIPNLILETEKERRENYVEDKLNQALTKKLGVIEIKREAEIKEKEKLEKNDSKEKRGHKMCIT